MFIKTIKVKKPTFAVIGAVLAALALLAVIIVTVVRISSPAVYEMKSEAQRQALPEQAFYIRYAVLLSKILAYQKV